MSHGGIKPALRREISQLVSKYCEDFDISQTNGSHIKVVLRRGTLSRFVICAATTSDYRAKANFAAKIRREVRTLIEQEAQMKKV